MNFFQGTVAVSEVMAVVSEVMVAVSEVMAVDTEGIIDININKLSHLFHV
jgi:hypothetical protein